MSFAIQCMQESIIASGGYASELDPFSRGIPVEYIIEAFNELIHKKLISEEYYEGKGHKVLVKMIGNTNSFEVDPSIKNDKYDESYKITFTEVTNFNGHEFSFVLLTRLFVGSKEKADEYANKFLQMIETFDPKPKVIKEIKKTGDLTFKKLVVSNKK